MRLDLLSVMLFAVTFLIAQEHAPSSQQCKADSRLWSIDMNSGGLTTLKNSPIGIGEMDARAMEMLKCSVAYEGGEKGSYELLANAYQLASNRRIEDFFKRHPDIRKKFLAEDDAGLR